ncbi:MAG TPA: restriction endonuclease subunit S [Thermodesulfobacteriota bacterium]|nr:restriction endonuclease subunit S [Thermodesulfobacteriota bacterium]
MADNGWVTLPFDQAVLVNPPVRLERGEVYPFVDMQAVDPGSRSVGPSELREFKGGGSRFMNGDTLMARITPCLENGKIARYAASKAEEVGHGSTEFIVIRGRPNVTDNGFAYYLTKWDGVRQYCISQMTGSSGRQRVPTSALSHREVTIPPLKEQEAIACILGTLDDKIELNRQMNRTLEEMARAIFKSWFVDFDPVRAKAAVRREHPKWTDEQVSRAACPNLKPEIAALFPDSFEDSELGEIPKGWSASNVGQHFRLTMGQSPPGSTYNEIGNGVPFYQGRTDFGFRYPTRRVYCTSPTRFAEPGDTLVSVRAPVGDVNMAKERCAVGRGVAAIRHRGNSRSFTYYSMHQLAQHFLKFEAEGTVFGSINKADFERLPFVVPSPDVLAAFDRVVSLLDDRIETNEEQTISLANIRDTLLPKLISGELRVPDAERIVGRCCK